MANPIPKIIHIVHAGGGMIPAERQAYIASFRTHNPHWQIFLWHDADRFLIDVRNTEVKKKYGKDVGGKAVVPAKVWQKVASRTGTGTDEETAEYLQKKFSLSKDDLKEQARTTYVDLNIFAQKHQIVLMRVSDLRAHIPKQSYSLYVQELVANPARGTNYGASSDILRIEVLHKYGGLYVDTDIICRQSLGDINVLNETPRFSVGNFIDCIGKGAAGVTQVQWNDDRFWEMRGFRAMAPILSNSIIAAQPNSSGLERYRQVILGNYEKAQADPKMYVNEYVKDFRTRTIQLTGPSAAAESLGFKDYIAKYYDTIEGKATEESQLKELHYLRENVLFPMYYVIDVYGHDWLK